MPSNTAAAELVVHTRREFDKHVADLRGTIESLVRYRLLELSRRVHALSGRSGFRRPQDLLRQQRQRADELTSRLAMGLRGRTTGSSNLPVAIPARNSSRLQTMRLTPRYRASGRIT